MEYLERVCVFLERGLGLAEAKHAAHDEGAALILEETAGTAFVANLHPRNREGEFREVSDLTPDGVPRPKRKGDRLGAMKTKDMERLLKKEGFAHMRQKGSHALFQHADGRKVILPMHARTVPRGTMMKVLRDARLA